MRQQFGLKRPALCHARLRFLIHSPRLLSSRGRREPIELDVAGPGPLTLPVTHTHSSESASATPITQNTHSLFLSPSPPRPRFHPNTNQFQQSRSGGVRIL